MARFCDPDLNNPAIAQVVAHIKAKGFNEADRSAGVRRPIR
jgi:hypothetical protein